MQSGVIHQGPAVVEDTLGNTIHERFYEYLCNPHRSMNDTTSVPGSDSSVENEFEEQLPDNETKRTITLTVDFQKMEQEDEDLGESIRLYYYRLQPFIERAAKDFVRERMSAFNDDVNYMPNVNVSFINMDKLFALRELRSESIGRLISISGTVTRTTDVKPELLTGCFICDLCGSRIPAVDQQFQFTKPVKCNSESCNNRSRFTFDMDGSVFTDWQRVKLQENTNEIPAGSMPRSLDLILRDSLVEAVKPGDKVIAVGCFIVIPDISQLSRQGQVPLLHSSSRSDPGITGLAGLGVRNMTYRTAFLCSSIYSTTSNEDDDILGLELTAAWKQDVLDMRNTAMLYEKLAESIAPGIYGHKDIKRGILLQLIGGVHKITTDGGSIRGDINICIVGDPSTAKSQFLKYVNSITPRSVYTSGKSSSAAGLTVGVARDADTRELCLEAGALMLSDNGICCIDEFDKMDYSDQVAIHEAMEQQTISITKAGITATLNARASILAAANPIGGRYDRSKSLKQNISITAPLMSRFDLFFIILDECDLEIDKRIASHIINRHRNTEESTQSNGLFTTEQIQHYVEFSKHFTPEITPEAQEMLVTCYRKLRENDSVGSRSQSAYRITVRQLESLIRLSEAIARVYLDDKVRPNYVAEANRLLKQSIIHVESADVALQEKDDWMETPEQMVEEPADEEKVVEEKVSHVTFEEYKRFANAAVMMLHKARDEAQRSNQEDHFKGQTFSRIVSDLLRAMHIDDSEEMVYKKNLVKMILRRLINKDHVLVVNCDIANLDEDDWIIDVHPNYVLS